MMKRILIPLLLAMVTFALAHSAAAGESGKCTASTQECLDKMTHWAKTSGWVGIEYEPSETDDTWTVLKVVEGSPAEKGGLQVGDVVFAMYGIEFNEANGEKLKQARKDWVPGQEVVYTVKRNGYDKKISLTLGAMPADVMAQWIGRHMLEHAKAADVADATP